MAPNFRDQVPIDLAYDLNYFKLAVLLKDNGGDPDNNYNYHGNTIIESFSYKKSKYSSQVCKKQVKPTQVTVRSINELSPVVALTPNDQQADAQIPGPSAPVVTISHVDTDSAVSSDEMESSSLFDFMDEEFVHTRAELAKIFMTGFAAGAVVGFVAHCVYARWSKWSHEQEDEDEKLQEVESLGFCFVDEQPDGR